MSTKSAPLSGVVNAQVWATARMFRMQKFTFSMPVTSHWTRLQMRSRSWWKTLSLRHALK